MKPTNLTPNKQAIVQIVQHLRPGGIETMALELLKELEEKADIYIFSLEGNKSDALRDWPRLAQVEPQLRFFDKQPGLTPALIKKLIKSLKEVNATSIHSHHIGPLLYGGIAARWLKLPHIHTEHDAWHLNAPANRRLQNLLLRSLKPTLVADCDAVAAELRTYFPHITPEVILNGIDTNRFIPTSLKGKKESRARLRLPCQGTIVGCAARLESVKGHEFLLKALSKTHTDISLALAGSGSLRKHLEHLANKLGIRDRVYFLGHLDDTLSFYHAIDLFCLPSLNEGLPLSPLEAQACGIPVIVTDVGGSRSIVCPQSGDVIRPGNVQALQHAILRQHFTPPRENPRNFVVNTGNLEKTALAYFNLTHAQREV